MCCKFCMSMKEKCSEVFTCYGSILHNTKLCINRWLFHHIKHLHVLLLFLLIIVFPLPISGRPKGRNQCLAFGLQDKLENSEMEPWFCKAVTSRKLNHLKLANELYDAEWNEQYALREFTWLPTDFCDLLPINHILILKSYLLLQDFSVLFCLWMNIRIYHFINKN